MSNENNQTYKYLSPIMLLLAMAVVWLICPPLLYLNDDITMRSILSGAYTGTPNGHAVYMQYPLTAILALLYRIMPVISWMEIFFAACIWVCMILIARELPHIGAGSFLVLIFFLPFFVFMHYTIIASIVGGTAVFLVCRSKRSFASIALLWIAFMIRSHVGLLCLPFIVAGLVWRTFRTPDSLKTDLKGIGKYAGMLAVGLTLISGINSLCYSSDAWQEYLAYNDSRTALYDYTNFYSVEKYAENYADYGMTKEEAQILTKYYTMLDSSIDSKRIQEIEGNITSGMWEDMDTIAILKNCIIKYYMQIRYQNFPYNCVWVAFYVVLAIGIVLTKKWLELAFLGGLGAGRSIIWLYFIWQDRYPERVVLAFYIIELLLMLAMSVSVIKDLKAGILQNRPRIERGCILALAVAGAVLGGYFAAENYMNAYEYREVQKEWQALREYCAEKEENIYFLDMLSLANFAEIEYSSKKTNTMMIGGWLTASPLAKARLEDMGGPDAAEVLYYSDNARLIADVSQDMSWLQEYLINRFGDCKLVPVNTIVSGWRAIIEYQVIN